MSPKTHILQQYGSQITCNSMLPVAYKLSADWFSFSPGVITTKSPQVLAPNTKRGWTYESTDSLMRAGIYSEHMMVELQKHMMFPHGVHAATKTIVRESMGHETYDQGLRFKHLIDENSIGQMVDRKLEQLWGWFTWFGNMTSGFLGIFFLAKMVMIFLNTGLNGHLLYQTLGMGLELLAAACTGLTHFLLHRHRKKEDKLSTENATEMRMVSDRQAIEDFNGTINAKTLKRNCATRWIERFHSVHDFIELLECVIDSLDTISSWADCDTSSQANNLKNSILQGEFIISLLVLSKIFAIGFPLSKQFQSVAIDLREAMVLANATLSELKTIRSNVDEYFHDIYTKASALAQELCFSITLPRIARKQKNRDNYSVNTPEEYFKITIFIPYLDLFINEIESRFIEHQKILKGFQNLFPKTTEMSTLEKDEFISLIDFYNDDLADNNKDILISELKLWQRKILALDKQPTNAMDALIICNDMYPNIYKLLQILATLPVSTASSERSFSSLKRIKTYLRNTMSEKRLNGLAMLSIHRSISVDAKEVLDELSTNKRRVDFIL